MRKCFAAFVAVMGLNVPAVAQPAPTCDAACEHARLLTFVRETSQRLDLLQARIDNALPPSTGIARVDGIVIDTEATAPTILIGGWGFTCDSMLPESDLARVVVVVDNIETGDPIVRANRPDVKVWSDAVGYCGMVRPGGGFTPTRSGANVRVPLAGLGFGPYGDGIHYIKLRVYDIFGRAVDSPIEAWKDPACDSGVAVRR